MQWIDVATFSDRDTAEALKFELVNHGLCTRVHDESALQRYWFLAGNVGSYRVEVTKGDESSAERWVRDWKGAGAATALHCPECHSTHVDFPQFTRKFMTISILPILFARLFHLQRYYCKSCHHTWTKDRT